MAVFWLQQRWVVVTEITETKIFIIWHSTESFPTPGLGKKRKLVKVSVYTNHVEKFRNKMDLSKFSEKQREYCILD